MVIVDEESMLTEDMLDALLDALEGLERIILVGDPAQLPPTGAYRPFADIVTKLRPEDHEQRFPRVGPGYVELTITWLGGHGPDQRLAWWFSAYSPSGGEDGVFAIGDDASERLRFVSCRAFDIGWTVSGLSGRTINWGASWDRRTARRTDEPGKRRSSGIWPTAFGAGKRTRTPPRSWSP